MTNLVLSIIIAFLSGIILGYFVQNKKYSKLQLELENQKCERAKSEALLNRFDDLENIFSNIVNSVIVQTNNLLSQKNQTLLEPLKNEIKEFKEKVDALNDVGNKNSASLKERIDLLMQNSDAIKFQALELTNALKQNSKSRGIFGEIVLEQILASSGLINKNENPETGNYVTQKGFKDLLDPTKNSTIPDAVIFYPEGKKNIVIDSKCPLNYFQKFVNETDEAEKNKYLDEFYKTVYLMIDNLSEKYNSLDTLNTPDFKILFIPIETAYLYTFENNELILNANKKNVVIAGPSSLVAILKIIKECWDTKKISDNLSEMQRAGNILYETFVVFLSKLDEIHKRFISLETAFDEINKTIFNPKGLIKRFENFKNMGLSPNKQIDKKYLSNNENMQTE